MLDLRNVHHHFWDVSAGPEDGDGSAETVCQKQKATHPHSYALRRRLKVVTDLCLQFDLEEHQTYFLQWAQERRGSLNLCCVKMQIRELPMHTVRKILQIFQPYCIEELELNTGWTLSTLACFTPCLGQMKNLCKLHLTLVHEKLHFSTYVNRHTGEECHQVHFSVLQTQQSPASRPGWPLLSHWPHE